MKCSWEEKNNFVNLLFEKGWLTEDEHRVLLLTTEYNGSRYITVQTDRIWFKDSKMDLPFLSIVKRGDKLFIALMENGRTVDSSIITIEGL